MSGATLAQARPRRHVVRGDSHRMLLRSTGVVLRTLSVRSAGRLNVRLPRKGSLTQREE